MLLVSGGTASFRPHLIERPDVFGTLVTPRTGNALPDVGRWAADNGAFPGVAGAGVNAEQFVAMLRRHEHGRARCLFVAVPDVVRRVGARVVGDHLATRELFDVWSPRLRAMGWPCAFVLQDGCSVEDVPWAEVAAVFIGGSDAFKLGPEAARISHAARVRGVWAHMGRVNTVGRILYAAGIGCSSVDGTSFSRWADVVLNERGFARLFRDLSRQRSIEPWRSG